MDTKKFLIILASSISAVFLAAFLAFWILFSNIQQNYSIASVNDISQKALATENTGNYFSQIDKVIQNQQKMFDKINKDFEDLMNVNPAPSGFMFIGNNKINYQSSASIKTEELKDCYKITVDLKPFNDDQKNVNLKVKDNTIVISAQYQAKDKNEFNSSNFYKTLTLPGKLDASSIKQEKQGDLLVITIPKYVSLKTN